MGEDTRYLSPDSGLGFPIKVLNIDTKNYCRSSYQPIIILNHNDGRRTEIGALGKDMLFMAGERVLRDAIVGTCVCVGERER